MNDSKGFTLTELLVASLMLLVAITGAMSFFIYQSTRGRDATQMKDARQTVALALSLMRRDIELSALGTPATDWMPVEAHPVCIITDDSNANASNSFYVAYDGFINWEFDIDNLSDKQSIFRGTPAEEVFGGGSTFVYNRIPVSLPVNLNTRPVGGFIVTDKLQPRPAPYDPCNERPVTVNVDWNNPNNKRTDGDQPWTVYLKTGGDEKGVAGMRTVVPATCYRIFPDPAVPSQTLPANQPTCELRRNDLRLAGGTFTLEVYRLAIRDRSFQYSSTHTKSKYYLPPGVVSEPLYTACPEYYPDKITDLSYEIILQYQIKTSRSQAEYTKLGAYSTINPNGKKTWTQGIARIRAEPKRFSTDRRAL